MAFTKTGNVVTQTTATTDTNLSGLLEAEQDFNATAGQTIFIVPGFSVSSVTVGGTSVSFTTAQGSTGLEVTVTALAGGENVVVTYTAAIRTFDGPIAVYELGQDVRLEVAGNLTIDPERERLVISENFGLNVTGILSLGVEKTLNGVTRFSQGVGLVFDVAPPVWHGSNGTGTSFRIQNNANFRWRGATIQGPFSFAAREGSTILIEDATMRVINAAVGQTDPTTGAVIAPGTTTGLNEGAGTRLPANRGYISWVRTPNYSIDNLTLEGDGVNFGGELIFFTAPSGMNTIDPTRTNGFRGYSAQFATNAVFPNRVETFALSDTRLGSSGNDIDVTVQTEGISGIAETTVTNEATGTLLRPLIAETTGLTRNRGTVVINRQFRVSANDLSTNMPVPDGGRMYIQDTNNGFRSNINNRNDLSDVIYTGGFTSGSTSTYDVKLGVVKVSNRSYSLGTNPVIPNGDRAYVRGTTTTVPAADNPNSMDIRGKNNVLGEDLFDVHVWHPRYQYNVSEVDMSDGTVGVRQTELNLPVDLFYQTADFAVTGEISTLDELYKAEKERKSDTMMTIQSPNLATLYTTPSGSNIDLGTFSLNVIRDTTTAVTSTTTRFSDVFTYNQFSSRLDGQFNVASSSAGQDTIFLPDINSANADVSADLNMIAAGDTIRFHGVGAFADQSFTVVSVTRATSTPNGVLVVIQGTLVDTGLIFGAQVTISDSVTTTTTQTTPQYAVDTANDALSIHNPAFLDAGSIFDSITTTGDYNTTGGQLDGINITARSILNPIAPGTDSAPAELDSVGGIYDTMVSLMPGTYAVNGDWSASTFERTGSTGTVNLLFRDGSVRPTAPLPTGVDAPFNLTINGRTDAGGRLSVYKNGALDTTLVVDANGDTLIRGTQAGTDDFVVVYTAPGRTDFREAVTNLAADQMVTVVTEAAPFPVLPDDVPMNDVLGANIATFTADTANPGRGIITIINDTTWSGSAAVTNYAIQNLVKGKEIYNNIVNLSGVLDGVRSLGAGSSAQVDGRVVTFQSSSPKTIGFVMARGDALANPISMLTSGRFFSDTTTVRIRANYVFNTANIAAGDPGEFSILPGRQFIDIHDVDGDTNNLTSALAGVMHGDIITITDRSDAMNPVEVLQALVTDNLDQPSFRRLNVADTIPQSVAAMLTGGNTYQVSITDATGSTIDVGVSFSASDSFDPGITASQIAAAVGETSDVANRLRFMSQGRNSVLPVQQTYDPDVEY